MDAYKAKKEEEEEEEEGEDEEEEEDDWEQRHYPCDSAQYPTACDLSQTLHFLRTGVFLSMSCLRAHIFSRVRLVQLELLGAEEARGQQIKIKNKNPFGGKKRADPIVPMYGVRICVSWVYLPGRVFG